MIHFRRASLGVIALSAFIASSLPLPSLAAAPSRQSILNQALILAVGNGSVAANGDLRVTLQLRGTRASDLSGSVDLTFNVANRLQSHPNDARSDARLSLKTATFKTALNGIPVSGTVAGNGAAVESRVVGNLLYVRVNNVSPEMQQSASTMGLDLSALQGKWVIFPVGILQFSNQLPFLLPVSQAMSSATVTQGASSKNILTIKNLEKSWTAANGHQLFRARLGVNTTILSSLQASETAAAKKKHPKDKAALTAIANRYAAMRKSLQGMDIVAEVDSTNGSLTRLELGGASSQSMKSCVVNSAGKQVCRTSGALSIRWNGGFSLQPDNGVAISRPSVDGNVNVAGN